MPNAPCPMPNAQCPMPNAQCPLTTNNQQMFKNEIATNDFNFDIACAGW
ncbi:hypothetical protein [Tolypothrix sp. VBCCA 56010]